MSLMPTLQNVAGMLKMAMEVLQMIFLNTLALPDIISSSRVMIMKLLLLLNSKSRIITMLGMILRLGLVVHPGSKPHLGQKPKLGGRYADISHIYISYFDQSLVYAYFVLFLLMFLFYFYSLKHKKTKMISVVSL